MLETIEYLNLIILPSIFILFESLIDFLRFKVDLKVLFNGCYWSSNNSDLICA